ncbi:hypothetical protein PINS_up009292 [Pythium insidiosum]|nr:hypothetical protein PINS_up009292 [Pythium insidiosum]
MNLHMRRDDVKPTLQLRHQLCAGSGGSGVIVAAAYDSRRHHLLTLVTAASASSSSSSSSPANTPPTLRLFSLRREIRSTPLFDDAHPPPPPVVVVPHADPPSRQSAAATADAIAATAIESAVLQYAPGLDVFLAVVSAWATAKDKDKDAASTSTPAVSAVFSLVVLEPGSLQKLVTYSGPSTHWLRCLAWDDASSRLVLSCKIRPHRPTTRASVRLLSPGGEHHCAIELLAITKRRFQQRQQPAIETQDGELPRDTEPPAWLRRRQERVMLCVERVRLPVWHADPLDHLVVTSRVERIFGAGRIAVSSGDDGSVGVESAVVEWRATEQEDASFLFARVVLQHRDAITALALTSDAAWLVTGHSSGALRVWTTDPHADTAWSPERADSDAADEPLRETHRSAVTALALGASASSSTTLFSTERTSGVVLHWQLVPTVDSRRLEVLGRMDVDPAAVTQERAAATKRPRGGRPPPTVAVSVAIPTATHTERLLVVARRDMIHVAKVQPVVRVVHRTTESLVALRRVSPPSEPHAVSVVTLTGTRLQSVLRSTWATPEWTTEPTHQRSLTPPATQRDATISSLHVSPSEQEPLLVVGWTTGVVEVFSVVDGRRFAMLQDPSVNTEITALSTAVSAPSSASAEPTVDQQPHRAWGGLLKAKKTTSSQCTSPSSGGWLSITAGSADGRLTTWRVELRRDDQCQLLLEASVRPSAAVHAAHVVGLDGSRDDLVSVGAEGMAKLWDRTTLQLQAHASLATDGRPLTVASCARVVTVDDAASTLGLVVGFDDGSLSCWRIARTQEQRCLSPLPVAGRHDRRVTALEPLHRLSMSFLSASLDMVVILWATTLDAGVQELRYFEMDNPIVDLCVVRDDRVVLCATAREVCAFQIDDEASEPAMSTVDVTPAPKSPAPELEEELPSRHEDPVSPPSSDDVSVDTSTPSVISIPSVVVPVSQPDDPRAVSASNHSGADVLTPLAGWTTDGSQDMPVDGEVLRLYVEQYIQAHGTAGTIAADALVHFLGLHALPLLGGRRRPAFAVRQALRDRKLEPKTRLEASEACELLLELQRLATGRRSDGAIATTTRGPLRKKKKREERRPSRVDDRVAVVTYNCVGEKRIEWVPRPKLEPTNQQQQREEDAPPPLRSSTRVASRIVAPSELPDAALVARLRLSQRFRASWSRGFCWCDGTTLRVHWVDAPVAADNDAATATKRDARCATCGKRAHTLRVTARGYRPHFSLRLLLGVLADVYDALTPSARALLQGGHSTGSGSETAASAPELASVSVHDALVDVFRTRYGVAEVVETKLKLLLLSMAHFVRDVDAVAVFGELLGAFAAPHEREVSSTMVALVVSSYAWLFSREMVHNGDAVHSLQAPPPPTAADVHAVDARTTRTTHWQFVRLESALFCAQELCVYPIVNPSFLRTIVQFLEDYAQSEPTRPTPLAALVHNEDGPGLGPPRRWLEVHRFLRLLVGEWRQQAAVFHAAEHELFEAPLVHKPALEDVLARLRLLLSCFVFFDHDRAGVVAPEDFEALLRRLRYVWPNEGVTAEQAASGSRRDDSLTFENAVRAACRRFADAQGDARVCYLDFWAMLYVVALHAHVLLKLREVPSFCRDYKLEVAPTLRDALVAYMQGTSSLLGPTSGSTTAPRVVPRAPVAATAARAGPGPGAVAVVAGGLHDGPFVPHKTLAPAVSLPLLTADDAVDALAVDGARPAALRRSDSESVLERRRIASSSSTTAAAAVQRLCSSDERMEPVVVGVRPTGPRSKPIALLSMASSVSSPQEDEEEEGDEEEEEVMNGDERQENGSAQAPAVSSSSSSSDTSSPATYLNLYVQFPDVSPRETHVPIASKPRRRVVARVPSLDAEALAWKDRILQLHLDGESDRARWRVEAEHRHALELQRAEQERQHALLERQRRQQQQQNASPQRSSPPRAAKTQTTASAPMVETPRASVVSHTETQEPVVAAASTEPEVAYDLAKTEDARSNNRPLRRGGGGGGLRGLEPETQTHAPLSPVATAATAVVDVEEAPMAEEASEPTPSPKRRLSIVIHERPPVVLEAREPSPRRSSWRASQDPETDAVDRGSSSEAPLSPQSLVEEPPVVETRAPEERAVVEEPTTEEVTAGHEESVAVDDTKQADTATETLHPSTSESTVSMEQQPAPVNERPATPRSLRPHESSSASTAAAPSEPSVPVVAAASTPEPTAVQPTEPRRSTTVLNVDVLPTPPPPPPQPQPQPQPQLQAQPPSPSPSASLPDAAVSSSAAPSHHRFRFSRQPTFRQTAAVTRTPLRSAQWNPSDDSDSDDARDVDGRRKRNAHPLALHLDDDEDGDGDDDDDAFLRMPLRLSPSALAAFQRTWGGHQRRHSLVAGTTLAPTPTPVVSALVAAEPSSSAADPHGEDDDPSRRQRDEPQPHGDEGVEIAFSPEAAQALEHRWRSFFATSEDALFSPLKQQLEARASAQRREEETQSRLLRKRQEQQRQDTMRLQRNSTSTSSSLSLSMGTRRDAATFRVRRMTRERCMELQQELRDGDSVDATLSRPHDARYFHFGYVRGSDATGKWLPLGIVTVKLHVTRGDAELFLSTETKAPCASDFAWRTTTLTTRPHGSAKHMDEGQKIVLFPSELARVLGDSSDQRVTFYLAVVALEPQTQVSVGVMASGQRGEPSRALRTVDELIARFTQLSQSYESSSAAAAAAVAAAASTSSLSRSGAALQARSAVGAVGIGVGSSPHAGLEALRRRASRRLSTHRLPVMRRRSSGAGGRLTMDKLIEEGADAEEEDDEEAEEEEEDDDEERRRRSGGRRRYLGRRERRSVSRTARTTGAARVRVVPESTRDARREARRRRAARDDVRARRRRRRACRAAAGRGAAARRHDAATVAAARDNGRRRRLGAARRSPCRDGAAAQCGARETRGAARTKALARSRGADRERRRSSGAQRSADAIGQSSRRALSPARRCLQSQQFAAQATREHRSSHKGAQALAIGRQVY